MLSAKPGRAWRRSTGTRPPSRSGGRRRQLPVRRCRRDTTRRALISWSKLPRMFRTPLMVPFSRWRQTWPTRLMKHSRSCLKAEPKLSTESATGLPCPCSLRRELARSKRPGMRATTLPPTVSLQSLSAPPPQSPSSAPRSVSATIAPS